jgi:hypothetical protein
VDVKTEVDLCGVRPGDWLDFFARLWR